jgi:cbb3-type cytochrome oxidase subunit 3
MSPTLLEGLLFLLLAALVAVYIGALVFAWWGQRRGSPVEERPAALPMPEEELPAASRGTHDASAERDEHHVR